ncbi:hypothetical protein [Halalkalibacter akibai]|uniref:DUF4825 domain-containing protein n=1 Tax=Halalkalibacter akibai (strain ATCC 43226 / DSM 21942 / CIP 109018 / JCM 9157 / 1139) TaxID=1236973 RepID=W4R0M3_HALA3|nr:hypothetical protein [Halalkalibacter akibai]GAE37727.1 hypothetical protein JCM9157_5053 [Halalkalibacter akibai JCM 9157]
MNKKATIILSSFVILIIISVSWIQLSGRTTFGDVLNEKISETDEITHIVFQARIGEILWTRIDDPELINSLIEELSNVSIKKRYGSKNMMLDYEMTIHTQSKSYFFNFDEENFSGNSNDYKVIEGSFVKPLLQLDLEWVTGDEFLGVD